MRKMEVDKERSPTSAFRPAMIPPAQKWPRKVLACGVIPVLQAAPTRCPPGMEKIWGGMVTKLLITGLMGQQPLRPLRPLISNRFSNGLEVTRFYQLRIPVTKISGR